MVAPRAEVRVSRLLRDQVVRREADIRAHADRVIEAWLASVARTEGPPELTVPAQTPRRMLPAPGEDVSRTIIDILSADPAEPVGQRAAAG